MTNVKRGITISNNLRWLRKLHGYTQKQVAEMLGVELGEEFNIDINYFFL